jgi:predicted site-specific integrase-resolvase
VSAVNLKEWAASQGESDATARSWYVSGRLTVPAYQAGRLIVIGDPNRSAQPVGSTVVYARVSSADQRLDLDRQVARVRVDAVVSEVGSTLNGHHRKFLTLLWDPGVVTIVVEHRDRFARFGAESVGV